MTILSLRECCMYAIPILQASGDDGRALAAQLAKRLDETTDWDAVMGRAQSKEDRDLALTKRFADATETIRKITSGEATVQDGWRDIESAPKGGADILVWYAGTDQQFVAYWWEPLKAWAFARHGAVVITLQDGEMKWRPLPAPPHTEGSAR